MRNIASRRCSAVDAPSAQTAAAAREYCSSSDRTSESSAWARLKSSAKPATRRDSSGASPNGSSFGAGYLLRSAADVDSRSFNKTFAGDFDSPSSMIVVLVPCEALYRFGRGIGATLSCADSFGFCPSLRVCSVFGAMPSIA